LLDYTGEPARISGVLSAAADDAAQAVTGKESGPFI
jgi:hypothetical protein